MGPARAPPPPQPLPLLRLLPRRPGGGERVPGVRGGATSMTAAAGDRERRLLLRHLQRGHPRCLHCGYSLRGLVEFRCPECGREITLKDVHWQGSAGRALPGLAMVGTATFAWGVSFLVGLWN